VGRTRDGVGVDQQPAAGDGALTAPRLGRRRPYVPVAAKFLAAQTLAVGWLGASIWLSLPWVRELAERIQETIAYVAG
jgi:hypothetical protein